MSDKLGCHSATEVHPQNVPLHIVQLQKGQLPNVHLPNVQLQNVQVTKCPFYKKSILQNARVSERPDYTVKKVIVFPVPSRDVTNQTLPGRAGINQLFFLTRESLVSDHHPPPPRLSRSGSKLVCNVNILNGNLRSENSHDYAQKPQRNFKFMNSASLLRGGGRDAHMVGRCAILSI